MLNKVRRTSAAPWRWRRVVELAQPKWDGGYAVPIALSLAGVGAVTVFLFAARGLIDLDHAAFGYLIPVIVAATRWGIAPALISAAAGVAATAFFFYEPIFDIRVYRPAHIADLLLFAIVAAVTAQLGNRVREHELAARRREEEMKALYFFSRRLSVASRPADIYAAIRDHLSAITGCRIVFFATGTESAEGSPQWHDVPPVVQAAVNNISRGKGNERNADLQDGMTGASWLIRPLLQRDTAVGILAIELGRVSQPGLAAISERVDVALGEAVDTLERIDVAHAIGEARVRAEAETLREALIGSVSHDLRTPLASIGGSASVLAQAPAVAQEERLAALVDVIRIETERLNTDIQNLLDAGRISSAGVRAHLDWADPSDIINAAIRRQQHRLSGHRVDVKLAQDSPLVRVDPILVKRAISQIVDNAVKYSRAGSSIGVTAKPGNGSVEIAVTDAGAGLTAEERAHMFERFYRGSRHRSAAPGSGLGLWIAQAFVIASGGELEARSDGAGRGTTVTVRLPAPPEAETGSLEDGDE